MLSYRRCGLVNGVQHRAVSLHYAIRAASDTEQQPVFQLLVVAPVLSRPDYGNNVLVGLPANFVQRLQTVPKAAARLNFRLGRSDHITDALAVVYTGSAFLSGFFSKHGRADT